MLPNSNSIISFGFILIVDDSQVQRQILQYSLEALNYKVISAQNGEEALSIIEEITPALIITDVVMPKMDGYELCRRLKSNKNTAGVPVILLTVLSSFEDMVKGIECGADSFISKPYSEEYLLNLVESTIANKDTHKKYEPIELPLFVSGSTKTLNVDPARIVSLMLSAYESAVSKNKELFNTQSELREMNTHLGDLVESRTEELSKLNSEKDKLFSIIAHDLRSPFQGFLGLTEIMANGVEEFSKEDLVKLGKDMNQNARNLYKLLQNLLDWSVMQKDAHTFNPVEIELRAIVAENMELHHKKGEQKGITVSNNIPANLYVTADEAMLNSIFRNLLSNAIKFSFKGGTVTINSRELENNMIEVSVADSGIGIPESILSKLFSIGEITGRTGTNGEKSTGLGLILCKEFVEKHSGNIWAESRENAGTTFYFTLPEGKTKE